VHIYIDYGYNIGPFKYHTTIYLLIAGGKTMEILEVKLLHKYARIRSYMNDLISGNYIIYDFLYECLVDHIESFIFDLAYIENEKVINIYYDQLLSDSKQVSNKLYTLVINIFEGNEWRF
jgi:hypothetical protein